MSGEFTKLVTKEMKLKNVKFKFTGGLEGGRGWKGDVKNMLLDISKLKQLGWKPKFNSKQAIRKTPQSPSSNFKRCFLNLD